MYKNFVKIIKFYEDFYKMYRNYTQGDAEVWVSEQVIQSDSIKQAIKFSLFFIFVSCTYVHIRRVSWMGLCRPNENSRKYDKKSFILESTFLVPKFLV